MEKQHKPDQSQILHPVFLKHRRLTRTRLNIWLENAWPPLLLAFIIIGSWAALIGLDLFILLPFSLRMILSFLAFSGVAFILLTIFRQSFISPSQAVDALALNNRIAPGQLRLLNDKIENSSQPEAEATLLDLAKQRIAGSIVTLQPPKVRSFLHRFDRFGLRAVPLLLILLAALTPWSGFASKAQQVFSNGASPQTSVRIEAWINPPSYINAPPQFLVSKNRVLESSLAIDIMENSILHIAVSGDPHQRVQAQFVSPTRPDERNNLFAQANKVQAEAGQQNTSDIRQTQFALKTSGEIAIKGLDLSSDLDELAWTIRVTEDEPPQINFTSAPKRTAATGQLSLSYKVQDDIGLKSAEARFSRTEDPSGAQGHFSLYEPPKFSLILPPPGNEEGFAQTLIDIISHPFAGQKMDVTLVAEDVAAQETKSDRFEVILPQRKFSDPLALALVDLRAQLALDKRTARKIGADLNALSLFPENFAPEFGLYLGLVTAQKRLENAKTDPELRTVVDQLWDMALSLEDGTLADARNRFENAQQALKAALQNGAPDETIQELLDELQASVTNLLAEMMRQGLQDSDQLAEGAQPQSPQEEELSAQDLQSLMDSIRQSAQSGERQQAQNLLNALNTIMNSLQMARGDQNSPQQDQNQQQGPMGELQDLMNQQRALMEETFKDSQRGRSDLDRQDRERLSQQQQALKDKLAELAEQLRDGMAQSGEEAQGKPDQQGNEPQPGQSQGQGQAQGQGQGPKGDGSLQGLRDALDAMENATRNLSKGSSQNALADQGEAMRALQQGGQQLADQLGQGQQGQQSGQGRRQGNPFGRTPQEGAEGNESGPYQVNRDAQLNRSRQIHLQIYRALKDQGLTGSERDYFNRLLNFE